MNKPDLTSEKFVQHPVYGRFYRTGDLVEKLPLGDFHYMGRIDTQVKIRGVRIELEGIESTLCQQEGVLDSACIVDKDRDQIIAFVVTSAAVPGTNCLTEELSLILPSQMVPSHIMIVDSLPRTISQKENTTRC